MPTAASISSATIPASAIVGATARTPEGRVVRVASRPYSSSGGVPLGLNPRLTPLDGALERQQPLRQRLVLRIDMVAVDIILAVRRRGRPGGDHSLRPADLLIGRAVRRIGDRD